MILDASLKSLGYGYNRRGCYEMEMIKKLRLFEISTPPLSRKRRFICHVFWRFTHLPFFSRSTNYDLDFSSSTTQHHTFPSTRYTIWTIANQFDVYFSHERPSKKGGSCINFNSHHHDSSQVDVPIFFWLSSQLF